MVVEANSPRKLRGGGLNGASDSSRLWIAITGRISTQPDGRIDSEQADVEWEQNTTRHASPIATRGQEEDDVSIFGASQYAKARAVREHYQARLAKIEPRGESSWSRSLFPCLSGAPE